MARLRITTGINEGIAYNAAGSNITEWPTGLPNKTVGSFFYDFAGYTSLGVVNSNEFAFVISDGRTMSRDMADEALVVQDGYDQDETDFEDEEYVGLDRVGHTTTVTSVWVELRFGFPTYGDVDVIPTIYNPESTEDDGMTNGILVAPSAGGGDVYVSLREWLDDQVEESLAGSGDYTAWWQWRAYLRWSLHWAFELIPLVQTEGENVLDDLAQAGMGPGGPVDSAPLGYPQTEPQGWVPDAGPSGLVYTLGGAGHTASFNGHEWPEMKWVRLWERTNPTNGVRILKRGHIAGLPYNLNQAQTADDNPAQSYEFDVTEGEQTWDIQGDHVDAPDVRSEGRELVVRCQLKTDIHVPHDKMLVFHIQSGRARLMAPSRTEGTFGSDTQGLIIARGQPALGPEIVLQHYNVTARGRHNAMPR